MDQQLDFLSGIFGPDSQPLNLVELAIGLGVTALLSLILGYVYIRLGSSLSNRKNLAKVLVVISLTTMLIITIVKSSLALSLGLVGALSIVRFRTAIKEPEELAYFFMAIAIGLGVGASQILATIVGAAGIFLVIYLLNLRASTGVSQNLIVQFSSKKTTADIRQAIDILKRHCEEVELRRMDEQAELSEIALTVKFAKVDGLLEAREELNSTFPNIEFSFLEIV